MRGLPDVPPRSGIPVNNKNGNSEKKDLFGSEPFVAPKVAENQPNDGSPLPDPFGLGGFSPQELQSSIISIDKRISEMKVS